MYYKKKYEEAMLRMNKWVEGSEIIEPKEVAEFVFPELKKSEDERIRKELKSFFDSEMSDYGNVEWRKGIRYGEIVAWLEKQDKKDSQVILPTFTFDDILALQCCMKKVQKDEELYNQLQILHDRLHDAYWLEKQGEQKPNGNCLLSWSEIDEKMLQSLEGIVKDYWAKAEQEKNEIKIREASNVSFFLKTIQKSPLCWIKCSDGLPNRDGTYLVVTDGRHNDVYDMARYDSIEGWHKASEIIYWMPIPQLNNKSIIEQKSTDKVEPKFKVGDVVRNISNGDTVTITQIVKENQFYNYSGWDGAATVHSDFSISEQDNWELVEQKHAWSEEDEEMFDAIIADIQFTQKAHIHDVNQIVYEREIDWLKTFKEKMKQLGLVTKQNKDNMIGKELMSPYQDLKKLK